jgi:2-amino-4-hydroxy-6-hydroxymethyldihydropteridine diphosphokinase
LTKRVRAYIGLGANVGDAKTTLEHAVEGVAALAGVSLRAVSPLYRTKPVGGVEQPDFLNAVVALDVPAGHDPETGALALLRALKQIERALGRKARERWGPREIDLDLLLFGRHQIDMPRLTVPHRDMQTRLFVLAPMADLSPGLRPPGWRSTIAAQQRTYQALDLGAVTKISGWSPALKSWV